jgi:hypothetical protein
MILFLFHVAKAVSQEQCSCSSSLSREESVFRTAISCGLVDGGGRTAALPLVGFTQHVGVVTGWGEGLGAACGGEQRQSRECPTCNEMLVLWSQ